jgi:hypothetical protein
MAAQSTRDTTTVLRDHTDWTTWISQLQSRCIVYKIWDKIDPESTAALLPKPAIPEPPLPSEYTPAANVLSATRVSELSTAGMKAYKEDLEHYKMLEGFYKNNLSEYQAETKGVQHIVTFIQSTVTPHLQRTCCLPSLSLRQWITNLSNTTGADTKLESKQARARYHAALRPLTRVSAWDTWLAEYDQAATEAETYHIVDVSHITAVVEDFLQAMLCFSIVLETSSPASKHVCRTAVKSIHDDRANDSSKLYWHQDPWHYRIFKRITPATIHAEAIQTGIVLPLCYPLKHRTHILRPSSTQSRAGKVSSYTSYKSFSAT